MGIIMKTRLKQIFLACTLTLLGIAVHAETKEAKKECRDQLQKALTEAACPATHDICYMNCSDTFENAAGTTEFKAMVGCQEDCKKVRTACYKRVVEQGTYGECLKKAGLNDFGIKRILSKTFEKLKK
jgi:hypothetical protein